MPAGCPPGGAKWTTPKYPAELFGASGSTVLVLDLDRCGQVEQIWIERDSGYDAFDRAAVAAASNWRMSPEIRDGVAVPSRVRVPVDFQPPGAEQMVNFQAKIQTDWEQRWPSLQVPGVTAAADGTVDGYLLDPMPMQAAPAQELIDSARASGTPIPGGVLGWEAHRYSLQDQDFRWLVAESGNAAAPALVRQRMVGDGEKSFWVSRVLCDAPADACAKLDRRLRRWPRQTPGDPLPKELPMQIPPPQREPRERVFGPRSPEAGDAVKPVAPDAPVPVWRRQ